METLIYNLTSFSESAIPVALIVPGVNNPPYSHRFKSLIYTKTSPNLYHLLKFIAVAFLFSFAEKFFYKRHNLGLKISWKNAENFGRPTFSIHVWVHPKKSCGSCLIKYLILINYLITKQLIMLHYMRIRVPILCYSGDSFRPRSPPTF